MTSLRPTSVCDTTPLQRFESQSSNGEEPSSPTAASIIAAASATPTPAPPPLLLNNNNMVKVDLQLPPFVNGCTGTMSSNKQRTRGATHIFGRIFLDLCLLGCVGLPMLGFSLWAEPYKRGFFCNDVSLKHPYKDSIIRSWMLYLMCLALPIVLIILVEFYRGQDKKPLYHNNTKSNGYFFCHLALPDWPLECYKKIGIFLFGLGVEQLTTNIAKYAIGRLRPHFFTLCQPLLLDGTTCSDPINEHKYIEDFSCSGPDMSLKMYKEMRLSFPSGHASFASYAMIYLIIYLQRRMHWSRTRMVCHLLQFLLLMFAWYTCLTRISDYKHHWSDVAAGAGIGVTYAFVVTSIMW